MIQTSEEQITKHFRLYDVLTGKFGTIRIFFDAGCAMRNKQIVLDVNCRFVTLHLTKRRPVLQANEGEVVIEKNGTVATSLNFSMTRMSTISAISCSIQLE